MVIASGFEQVRSFDMKNCAALFAVLSLVFTGAATAHGGGCRKSSPPGQCCHMDRKAGTVHCH